MSGEKSAAIIGAGIGGIATAIYLAKNGYKVDVYEKNSSVHCDRRSASCRLGSNY